MGDENIKSGNEVDVKKKEIGDGDKSGPVEDGWFKEVDCDLPGTFINSIYIYLDSHALCFMIIPDFRLCRNCTKMLGLY